MTLKNSDQRTSNKSVSHYAYSHVNPSCADSGHHFGKWHRSGEKSLSDSIRKKLRDPCCNATDHDRSSIDSPSNHFRYASSSDDVALHHPG